LPASDGTTITTSSPGFLYPSSLAFPSQYSSVCFSDIPDFNSSFFFSAL